MSKYSNLIKYNSRKEFKKAIELYKTTTQFSGTITTIDHKELIVRIGDTLIKRGKLLNNTYFKSDVIIDNYYIDNYFFIVRGLITPYYDNIKTFIENNNYKHLMTIANDWDIRNKLDRYFIEMLYGVHPILKNSGLPLIFCDTLSTNDKEGYMESYYLL